jgi:pyridine nucleotide-disulfide oxidoreductase family protein
MKRLVLVGGGHAHVHVLQAWAQAPMPGVQLTVVSPSTHAPYSGMVPGWLAGHYSFDDISINVAALARAAQATFVEDNVQSLDITGRTLRLQKQPPLPFDVLSLNVGSTLWPPMHLQRDNTLCMRPLGELRQRWQALLDRLPRDGTTHRRVIAGGGGPAAVEAMLAVLTGLRAHQPSARIEGLLITMGDDILEQSAPGARRAMHRVLRAQGVRVLARTDATQLGSEKHTLAADPLTLSPQDIVLWATGAQALSWPRDSGLSVDAAGFVRVDRQLRSISHPNILAAGDCAAWPEPLPKAGVMAVRMGPVLSDNLRAALADTQTPVPWVTHTPQRRSLALLATGDHRAIASWGRWSAQGAWVWRWKDRIDRRFVARFNGAPSA